MYYRYTDSEIYPYDLSIDFKFNITNPNELLELIDIEYVRKIIRDFKIASNNTGINIGRDDISSSTFLKRVQDANSTLYVYDQISSGLTIELNMNAYRNLIFKTTAKCFVFNMSMNILRLIGGYGVLAYSGNS